MGQGQKFITYSRRHIEDIREWLIWKAAEDPPLMWSPLCKYLHNMHTAMGLVRGTKEYASAHTMRTWLTEVRRNGLGLQADNDLWQASHTLLTYANTRPPEGVMHTPLGHMYACSAPRLPRASRLEPQSFWEMLEKRKDVESWLNGREDSLEEAEEYAAAIV